MAGRRTKDKAKPAVFVGSSVEGLDVAYGIQENLEHDAEITVWPQGVFDLSQSALMSLVKTLEKSDFGIFVFTPDDRVRLRKQTLAAVRDNVVFELGLFTGKLGSDRIFIVIPADAIDLRIPTDLTGVTAGTYNPKRKDQNLVAALGPFSNQVRRVLKKRNAIRRDIKQKSAGIRLRGIEIHSAHYGVRSHRIDVKKKLVAELRKTGTAYIGNQLGGDPAPNTSKDLQLDFTYQGERQQVVLPEGISLAFPD